MNSYFQASNSERFVTVWPGDEFGFYDVVYGPVGDGDDERGDECRTVHRVTAHEAAAYICTEVGVGVGVTLVGLEQKIREWRAEYDARPRSRFE